MPQIIPIRDLKNTSEVSERCHATSEPIFITKNGYGDMVLMSMETYEAKMRTSMRNCCRQRNKLRKEGSGRQRNPYRS